MSGLLDAVRDTIRHLMRAVARSLHRASRGRITPNMVTLLSLIGHIPIAYFIASSSYTLAASLLVIFGLFDALDGELARLQQTASSGGMLLDASTDRMKEVLLYIGVGYTLIEHGTGDTRPAIAAAAVVAACGGSLLVSYVKAKGETAVHDSKLSANQINRLFQDGLMRFEVRMFALVVGLLIHQLMMVVIIIAVLSWLTAFDRLQKIYRKLS